MHHTSSAFRSLLSHGVAVDCFVLKAVITNAASLGSSHSAWAAWHEELCITFSLVHRYAACNMGRGYGDYIRWVADVAAS